MNQVLVCRTCLRIVETGSKFVHLDAMDTNPNASVIKSKLEACVPEMTLDIVKSPVICSHCVVSLEAAFEFKRNCLRIEEEIYVYVMECDGESVDLGIYVTRSSQPEPVPVKTEISDTPMNCNDDIEIAENEVDLAAEVKIEPNTEKQNFETCPLDTNENVFANEQVPGIEAESVTPAQDLSVRPCTIKAESVTPEQDLSVRPCTIKAESVTPEQDLSVRPCTINAESVTPEQDLSVRPCSVVLTLLSEDFLKTLTWPDDAEMEMEIEDEVKPPSTNTQVSDIEKPPSEKIGVIKPQQSKCFICRRYYNNKKDLKNHSLKHTESGDNVLLVGHPFNSTTLQPMRMELRRRTTTEKRYRCGVCCLNLDHALEAHMRIHTGEEPFNCFLCDFRSARKSKLKIHLNSHSQADKVHSIEKRYKCVACKFSTTEESVLQMHAKTHNRDKHNYLEMFTMSYNCMTCKFFTVSRDQLSDHLKMKTEKPTIWKNSAKTNISAKTNTNGKLSKCSMCKFSTGLKQVFREHWKVHVDKRLCKCLYCSFTAEKTSGLFAHMKSHPDKAILYQCGNCDFTTDFLKHLEWHLDVHVGKQFYRCFHCSYRTYVKEDYNNHTRTHRNTLTKNATNCT